MQLHAQNSLRANQEGTETSFAIRTEQRRKASLHTGQSLVAYMWAIDSLMMTSYVSVTSFAIAAANDVVLKLADITLAPFASKLRRFFFLFVCHDCRDYAQTRLARFAFDALVPSGLITANPCNKRRGQFALTQCSGRPSTFQCACFEAEPKSVDFKKFR